MEFINHTNYSTLLFRTIIADDKFASSAIVRVTYDIKNSIATPSLRQEWELHDTRWESEFGPMENDNVFRLGGVDIFVFGKAIAPKNSAVTRMNIKIDIKDKLSHKIVVFGNRFWEKSMFGMSISMPEPFAEMPLTLYNAYGGMAEWDGLKFPYANNAFGKGYYWKREDAFNMPLPNIENPNQLIHKWDDRPDPAGIASCPMNGIRVKDNIIFDNHYKIKKIGAGLFNSAFPGMITKEVKTGEKISIEGLTYDGVFNFIIPGNTIYSKISIGEKIVERKMNIDQVGIIPEKNQAFITYRFPFTYTFKAQQKRICEIFEYN